ncbi:MAG: hypothetical protein ACE15C_14460 [Phycisphaerae bacterium]
MTITAKSRARITWNSQAALGAGDSYNVYGDGGSGSIDYDNPLNAEPIPHAPELVSSAGWGYGSWGYGLWGQFSPMAMAFITQLLADGTYLFAVCARDEAGNETHPAAQTASVTLAGQPRPPANLKATAYAAGSDTVTFTWTRSPDDV